MGAVDCGSEKTIVASQEQSVPAAMPTMYPPIINLGLEARWCGMQKAMKQLTRKQREVIYYIYYKNLSYTEAREIMKINTDKTIRNLLYRALGSMRAVMKYLSVILLITIRFI